MSRSFESGIFRYEVTSELGDDFLFFDEWAKHTLTEEEYQITQTPNFFDSETGIAYNKRWKQEQKITSVSVYENNVLQTSAGIGPGYMYEWGEESYI